MLHRTFWESQLEAAWAERSVVWLAGVRRSGKTTLCRSLPDTVYYDCERPRVRRALEDPEAFLEDHRGQRVVLDEIHRLDRPSELLKIAADHFPDTRILATGSSTLGASQKFNDTLTGRKRTVWLPPMIHQDLTDFGQTDLRYRMLRGGLPPMFLAPRLPRRDYQEWFDGYWAKDLQELFRLERREGFRKLMELLFIQSGGLFEASSFASPCGISRTTVQTYLGIIEETFLVKVLRPFHSGGSREILQAPKVYAFDTGFVCHHKGLEELGDSDLGPLWEHLVLNELLGFLQGQAVHYWRNKQQNEVDFVLAGNPQAPVALEAKWKAEAFDPGNLRIFRKAYPHGGNFLVAQDVDQPYTRQYGETKVRFIGLRHIKDAVAAMPGAS
jgi:predicted AAA+ superfamily ATPase